MKQQDLEVKPSVEPIEAPKKFVPQAYVSIGGAEPFSNLKLTVGSRLDPRQSSNLLAAETRRRKEPLEAYPLDSLSMVGSVVKQGRPHALIKADNLLFYVKAGEYIGQNFGKVTKLAKRKSACVRSFKTPLANGLSAPVASSFRRRRDEQ